MTNSVLDSLNVRQPTILQVEFSLHEIEMADIKCANCCCSMLFFHCNVVTEELLVVVHLANPARYWSCLNIGKFFKYRASILSCAVVDLIWWLVNLSFSPADSRFLISCMHHPR